MKVVFVAGHEFAGHNNNGGKQGSRKLYDLWVKAVGAENIHVIMFSNVDYETDIKNIHYFPSHRNKLEQMKNACFMRNGYNYFTEKRVKKFIESLSPDIVYFDHSNIGRLLKGIKLPERTKTYVFLHNVEHDYVWNKVRNESLLYFIPYLSYWKNEAFIVKYADVVMNLNERDSRRMSCLYGRESDYLIPVSYYDIFEEKNIQVADNPNKRKLLFVGAYVGPNIKGIEWFVKEVFPYLSGYELVIVGMNMEKLSSKIDNPQIKIIGTVEDTSPYYYDADTVVIPILYGAGMKTKTAEAMMYGKRIVATDEALEGYAVEGVNNIYRANSANEFISILNDVKDASKYCSDVRNIFVEKYCTDSLEEQFVKYINNI